MNISNLHAQVNYVSDSEGDDIIVSSNEELLEALSGDSDCYKLHVTIVSKECITIENKPEQDSLFAPMPGKSQI
jgi:hypothetical protein